MMLIEVHTYGMRTALNVEKILGVQEHGDKCVIFCEDDGNQWETEESYDEVLDKILEATEGPEPEDFMVPGFLMNAGDIDD